MAVPKQRQNSARRGRRRAGQRKTVTLKNTQKCSKCGANIVPHRACPNCGFYKGKEVVDVMKKNKTK